MRKGLKKLRVSALGKPGRDAYKKIDKENREEFLKYAQEDAEDTLELYEHYLPMIQKEEVDIAYELDKAVTLPALEMEFLGTKIDLELLDRQDKMLDMENGMAIVTGKQIGRAHV